MAPLSNKITIQLLAAAALLLVYWIADLSAITSGRALVEGPAYPLYISTAVTAFTILGLLVSVKARTDWERRPGQ